jgi:hypothetical protein
VRGHRASIQLVRGLCHNVVHREGRPPWARHGWLTLPASLRGHAPLENLLRQAPGKVVSPCSYAYATQPRKSRNQNKSRNQLYPTTNAACARALPPPRPRRLTPTSPFSAASFSRSASRSAGRPSSGPYAFTLPSRSMLAARSSASLGGAQCTTPERSNSRSSKGKGMWC